jgi:phosphoglycerol transferase MdoB-like AlkP superfamily enzyme
MEQCVAQMMLLGPVSGATPGPGDPVFNFLVGGLAIIAVSVHYFKIEKAKRPPVRNLLFVSAIGAVFIMLGVWDLISPR